MRIKYKHFISFCLSVVICSMSLITLGTAATKGPGVVIDGTPVQFSSDMGEPFIDENNRTQVPLRVTMEAMGAKVDWDAEVRTAVVSKGSVTVRVPIGAEFVWINSEKKTNDTAAVIVNSRTYLPIRIVAEALGADVGWDGNTKTVKITTHGDPVVWVRSGETWYEDGKQIFSMEYNIEKQENKKKLDGTTEYIFNKRGQLEAKTATSEDSRFVTDYSYNNMGLMTYYHAYATTTVKEEDWSEEVWYEYNNKGDPTKVLLHLLLHGLSGPDYWNQTDCSYTYDKEGRVSKMVVHNPPAGTEEPPESEIHVYKYDSFDRIVEEQIEYIYRSDYFPASNFVAESKYEYDAYGNIVRKASGYNETKYSYRQFDPSTMNSDYLLFPLSKGNNIIWPDEFLEPNAPLYIDELY